ncbi:hypothetical protein DFP93_11351 [Aneurinibacillus soli]|uniref:Putative stage IV sporulation protein YqfD n=1 Tax=Aneurinibacillus soli TaxID=1500254 RepID=A0A0U5AU25_9BACL|nr:sporulation protein YqfD [Aneurinibacillus soli]PYE60342.1 hypothetical protein DFP93_11351 [Aneurinibacillus soli]BAU27258.1 putative stage IV sporulation protein YqfD [Aneurinibacillus soli]
MKNGVNWFQGYLVLRVRGRRLERFLNRVVGDGIHVWDIHRTSEEAYMSIPLDSFFALRPFLRETGCRVHVVRRVGLPFVLRKLRTRFMFGTGIVLFILGVYMLSQIVWRVEVVGNERIPAFQIQEMAARAGVKPGVFTFQIPEPKEMQRRLLLDMPNASWIGFEMKGTTAIIRVVEKVLPTPRDTTAPRHIIATKKAIVHSIFAESGRPLVRPQSWVNKGDILISGALGNEEQMQLVAAKGIVEGETWYESEVTVPIKQKRPVLTGEAYTRRYLMFGTYEVKIQGFGAPEYKQSVRSEDTDWISTGERVFPLGMKTEVVRQNESITITLTEKEAIEIGKKYARENLVKRLKKGGYIKTEKVLHENQENGKVYMKLHFVVVEDIAAEQPITEQPITSEGD